jgi:predicted NUDIX family NTP pyrophosphohydrolase
MGVVPVSSIHLSLGMEILVKKFHEIEWIELSGNWKKSPEADTTPWQTTPDVAIKETTN